MYVSKTFDVTENLENFLVLGWTKQDPSKSLKGRAKEKKYICRGMQVGA